MSSTTLKRQPPFRAEHIGSLKRPSNLLQSRVGFDKKEVSASELKAIEDETIKEAVEKQLQIGFRAVTDGEYRRHMFWGTFHPSLNGNEEIFNPSADIFREYVPDIAAFMESGMKPGESVICTGKISHPGTSTYVDQVAFLQTLLPREQWAEIKLTLAVPNWYHLRYKEGKAYPKEVYAGDEEYFADIAKAYQVELDLLYKAGLRNVQFDDPNLAYFCSEKMLEGWKKDPLNTKTAEELFSQYIDLYNACIEKVPEDMHIGIHLCRGNFVKSRHFSEGGYDRIADALFTRLRVHTYYLEYDTARAGTFTPLRHLPRHKSCVLGLVTSKFPALEDRAEMAARVRDAARTVAQGSGETEEQALARLGVSPQCGFASHEEGNLIDPDAMWRKLALVRAIADEVWPGEA